MLKQVIEAPDLRAEGDVPTILGADVALALEGSGRFCEALRSGRGDFINGVRLVYPVRQKAMRFANPLGNKFFALAVSWLLGQPVKDTLRGTKALWRVDYGSIAVNRAYFGDFDLLFGAENLNLKSIDLPIRYRERTYGTTNIQRSRHGWLLLKMALFGVQRIKLL